MPAPYYAHGAFPTQSAPGSSSSMRSELDAIDAGFALLPTLAGNGGKVIAVNADGSAQTVIAVTGTGNVVLATSPVITTPTGIVKGDVGLGNVDNTSDANKPVSTAQATAIALKSDTTTTTTKTSSTGASIVPVGTTAQRDASPLSGYLRYNSTTLKFEGFSNAVWGAIGGGSGATGAGQDNVFVENDKYQTTNYTIGQSSHTPATVSIATPGVVSQPNTYVGGEEVFFKTTGALPTGLSVDTTYFVITTGLTSAVFQVALTRGGAAIATSGTQSGAHTSGKAKSAQMVGPFTVATGATLTIPSGQRLVIQ